MRTAIYVNLDGLRRDMIDHTVMPVLAAFGARATRFNAHRSVFPSCTRVVSASIATGCHPGRHGLQGNSFALMEDGRLIVHDAGRPDFLAHKLRVTGTALAVPTLAEFLHDVGGAVILSNVSPGAATAHDPEGHGHVYHRAGSFGPGRTPLTGSQALAIEQGIAGDAAMTDFLVGTVLRERLPALAVLWFGQPDLVQHFYPLGSEENLREMRAVDAHLQRVVNAVDALRARGLGILLLVGSDHGHQTVTEIIDIEGDLVEAGLKAAPGSGDVVSVSNGTSALIHVHPSATEKLDAVEGFLRSRPWCGALYRGGALAQIGQAPEHGLAMAVSMAYSDAANGFGVPGASPAAKPAQGKPDIVGAGQHGGDGSGEQSPFLFASGSGFEENTDVDQTSSVIDIAPTILTSLGVPFDPERFDGRALQSCALRRSDRSR